MSLRTFMEWVAGCVRLAPLQMLAVLLALIIGSCGSSKKAQRQSGVARIETSTKSADSASVIKEHLITATGCASEDLRITITEYDTAQPIDSVTGKPPVRKETRVEKRRSDRRDSGQRRTERRDSKSEAAERVHVQDSVSLESVKEKAETTVPKQIGGVVWAACALIGLIIVLYIVRRFGKK